jgi:hypothetical protein
MTLNAVFSNFKLGTCQWYYVNLNAAVSQARYRRDGAFTIPTGSALRVSAALSASILTQLGTTVPSLTSSSDSEWL